MPTSPKKPSRRTSRPAPAPAEASARWAVTTVRLRADQWSALRRAALERAEAQGGKADASAVLRDVLDAWIQGRR
jgi:hypothetical protein